MSTPKVYFYCCPERDNLQDDIVILAEGLRALGIPYFSNADYWQRSPAEDDVLFRHTPDVTPDDCDVVVLPYTWYNWIRIGVPVPHRRPTPPGLFRPGRPYRTVYMDTNDGLKTVSWEDEFRQFDVIYRTKYNRRYWQPDNLKPWVLGLSERIIAATEGAPTFAQRRKAMLVNFGASHHYPHTARIRSHQRLDPLVAPHFPIDSTKDDLAVAPEDATDRLMWEQTNRRHCRAYYDRLKNTQLVSTFCGALIPAMPWKDPNQYLVGGNKAKVKLALYKLLGVVDPRPERIVQWDSWRFWEALAAGCVAINLDLDRYGAALPVMPKNGVHYLGVDLDRPQRAVERLVDDPAGLAAIATQGRAWALEHYSPRAMAARFLSDFGWSAAAPASIPAGP